jgi:hypothetical protein
MTNPLFPFSPHYPLRLTLGLELAISPAAARGDR